MTIVHSGNDQPEYRGEWNYPTGYLNDQRHKVRAWFNAQITHETVARGREAVEKVLQREGKTAMKLDDLASQLESCFTAEDYSARTLVVFTMGGTGPSG